MRKSTKAIYLAAYHRKRLQAKKNQPDKRRAVMALDKDGQPLGPINKLTEMDLIGIFHVSSHAVYRRQQLEVSRRPPKKRKPCQS